MSSRQTQQYCRGTAAVTTPFCVIMPRFLSVSHSEPQGASNHDLLDFVNAVIYFIAYGSRPR